MTEEKSSNEHHAHINYDNVKYITTHDKDDCAKIYFIDNTSIDDQQYNINSNALQNAIKRFDNPDMVKKKK